MGTVVLTGAGRTGFVCWGGGTETEEAVGVEPVDDFNLAIPAYDAKKNAMKFLFYSFNSTYFLQLIV